VSGRPITPGTTVDVVEDAADPVIVELPGCPEVVGAAVVASGSGAPVVAPGGSDVDVGGGVVVVVVAAVVVVVAGGDVVVVAAVVVVVAGGDVVVVVGGGGDVTVKVAVAELVPCPTDWARTVCAPSAAPAGTVRVVVNAPDSSVRTLPVPDPSHRICRISSGAKPLPDTVMTVSGVPLDGARVMTGAADAMAVTSEIKPITVIGTHQRPADRNLRSATPQQRL